MGQLAYRYPTKQPISKEIHVGVAGSGDLEILTFPTEKEESTIKIYAGSNGFGEAWNNVLTRFFDRYPTPVDIVINDFGATPGVVYLRLA